MAGGLARTLARGRGGQACTVPLTTFEVVGSRHPSSRGSEVAGEGSVPGTGLEQRGVPPCRDVGMHLGLKHASKSQYAEINGRLVIKV